MNTVPPTSRPQLVYLVFGADTYHQEAVFSIASALAFLQDTPDANIDIQVFSDNPEPYRLLPGACAHWTRPPASAGASLTAITFAPNTWCCAKYCKNPRWRC